MPASRARRAVGSVTLLFAMLSSALVVNSMVGAAASCDGPGVAIYHRVRPADGVSLYTANQSEAAAAVQFGFTDDRGVAFRAEANGASGTVVLHRLQNQSTWNFVWMRSGGELNGAVANYGYVDNGEAFSVATSASGCHLPVSRFMKDGFHRLAATETDRNTLRSQGWADEGVRFYARPSDLAPTTTTTTTTTTVAPPVADIDAGSEPIGSTTYPIPAGATVVATSGNDSNPGTLARPVRTLERALKIASTNSTIVLRGGTYREDVAIYKKVTIQSAPGEIVWLDGSAAVTGWTRTGNGWRHDNWTTRFDSSPTYSQGAPDGPAPFYNFVDPDSPMAAHPDQLWINDQPQRQVASLNQLQSGTFYLDEGRSQLHVGSNPSNANVTASVLPKALSVRAAGVVVRGIGIRRYAPSVWMVAGVTLESSSARVENVVISEMATTGISILGTDSVLDRVTVQNSGMLGIHARRSDRLQLESVLSRANNQEGFSITPSAGGLKVVQTAGITARDSVFERNDGQGFWTDWSVSNIKIANSRFSNNTSDGLFVELSDRVRVIDSFFADNGRFGIKVNNTSDVEIWNNSFTGNNRPINLVQDDRRNDDRNDAAVDPRRPWPDPTMTWTNRNIKVFNNVVDGVDSTADCLICAEDYSRQHSAAVMGITTNSNVYNRPAANLPVRFVIWARGVPNPALYGSLDSFTSATGQERLGVELVNRAVLDDTGSPTNTVTNLQSSKATPLSAEMAALAGRSTGERRLGLWP